MYIIVYYIVYTYMSINNFEHFSRDLNNNYKVYIASQSLVHV